VESRITKEIIPKRILVLRVRLGNRRRWLKRNHIT
jgi:hypothetical protein